MAMLAERKRKQKWSLNPRGKEWSEDSNKFGQKLLEKMGWSQGKGLGAKENGIIEHVKISYKNDSKGMGFKDSNDQWTEHEQNFNSLLENLTGEKPEVDLNIVSLEKKSQSSRARVHYHKFTRGKDLSRYSEKDLANIFGKKSLKEPKKSEETEENKESSEVKSESSSFTFHGGTMVDYFKKKLGNFSRSTNGYVVGSNGVLKKEESDSESELRTIGFGFNTKQSNEDIKANEEDENKRSSFISYVSESQTESEETPKKKKKKFHEDNNTPNSKKRKLDEQEEHNPKKKKMKNDGQNGGLSNPAFDPLHTPIKLEKHILNPIEEKEESIIEENYKENEVKKSKKKKRESVEFSQNEEIENPYEVKVCEKKKKKEKKKKVTEELSVINPNFSFSESEECASFNEEAPITDEFEVKRKNKKSKKKKDEVSSEEIFEESNVKKSKKKKSDSEEIFQESTSINEETSTITEEFEVKRKNKKSKKKKSESDEETNKFATENPVFNDSTKETDNVEEISSNFEVKRKSKKKDKKKKNQEKEESIGLDNPALNLNDTKNSVDEESLNLDLMLNVTSEETTEEIYSTTNETFTITKVNTVKRRKSVRFSDVNEEFLIPNNKELREMELSQQEDDIAIDIQLNVDSTIPEPKENNIQKKKEKKNKRKGITNTAFDTQTNILEENVDTISKTIDKYQAEIENDINEKKAKATNSKQSMKTVEIDDVMVGEVGNPDGENMLLPDGSVKLKFKNAKFGKSPWYVENLMGPKKSYKHLIKGDIIVGFKDSNLHEINGYAMTGVTETAV